MDSLSSKHQTDLSASGISAETIARLGIRSVGDVEAFEIIGLNCGSALAFPYPETDFIRLKPDRPYPIPSDDGKVKYAKYLSPKGSANRLYVPPSVRPILDDASRQLLLTEGEKKSAKASQEGFPTLGLIGIWGFRDRDHQLIPDLAEGVVWGDREVHLAADSDVATNPQVRSAVWELGWQIRQLGAIVRVAVLPSDGQHSEKVGLDDFLVIAGPDRLADLLGNADDLVHWAIASIANGVASSKGAVINDRDVDWLVRRLASLPELEVMQVSSTASKLLGQSKSEFRKLLQSVGPWRPKAPKAEREESSRRRMAEKADHEETAKRNLSAVMKLARDPAILHRAINMVGEQGVAGEQRAVGILRLAVRSRSLRRPINVQVHSPSSTGKTHVVLATLSLEDPSAFYELTASSEKALIFLSEPLEHRFLYFQEPEGLSGGAGAAAIKSLIWEGRLKYDTVVQVEGEYVTQHVEKDGPTGLIITTTKDLEEQISNRMFRIELDPSKEQTRRILQSIALDAEGATKAPDLQIWQEFSRLMGEPADVTIPFASWLGDRVSIGTLRIRRDFTQFLNFIRACALEYRCQRHQLPGGTIQATVADYAMVHALVADLFEAAQGEGVTELDRLFLKAVTESTEQHGRAPSQADLVRHMNASKGAVSHRVNRLQRLGYLENHEERKGRAAQLALGTPPPDSVPPLPDPCELSAYVINGDLQELVQPWVNPISGESHDCREHLNAYPEPALRSEGDRSPPQMNGPEHLNSIVQPFTTVQSRHERSRNAGLQPFPDDRSGVQSDIDEDILEI